MKTLKHLFTALLLLCSSVAFAHSFEVDGIYYNITNSTTKEVAVTYSGSSSDAVANEYTGSVVIPSTVSISYWVSENKEHNSTSQNSYTIVAEAGDKLMFDWSVSSEGNYDWLIVTIDETEILKKSGVDSGTFEKTFDTAGTYTLVVKYTKDGSNSNYSDQAIVSKIAVNGTPVSIDVTYSVTSIGNDAFRGCSGLTSVVIPNSVTSIGHIAFYGCSGLTSVVIPNSVTSIGASAFEGCTGLTSVVIPNSVTSIGGYAFRDCSGLTSVAIPSSVTSIGNYAFYNCSGLTSVEIPNSVRSIGEGVFKSCSGLTSVEIPNSVTSIRNEVFRGCSGLTSIVIPSSVTSIGDNAFYGCSGLTSIEIPNSVTSIGDNVFQKCTSLKELRIEDGEDILSLGEYTGVSPRQPFFRDCPLETLYLGRDLSYNPGDYYSPFKDRTTLKNLTIGNSVTSIRDYAFSGCSGLTGGLVIPDGVTSIGDYAFNNCSGFTGELVIPNAVTSIGDYAFNNCSGLTGGLVIPDGVTSIGDYAFNNCSGLTGELVIPNAVTSIGERAFYNCSGFTGGLAIPDGVTSIGSYAFNNCSGLNSVIDFVAETPATVGLTAFHANAVIVVPDAAVDAYKGAWSDYAAQITGKGDAYVTVDVEAMDATSGIMERIGLEKMASIAKLAVKGSINSYDVIQFRDKMPLLRELDLSEATVVASDKAFYSGNCTKDNALGGYAFYGLSKLNYVKLPKDLVSVGDYMFRDCSSLREIELPETVQSIGSSAFYNCDALKEITIPAGIKSINSYTFYDCDALERVVLPDGLETIGWEAFYSCNNLKEIKLPPTVKTIDSGAFEYCPSLEEIRIPSSVTSIGSSAFAGCRNLKKVYTYTVEPTTIQENTFSTFGTATLYVPSFSFSNYYWDDGWKRFLNLAEFNEPYEYFYVNNDYTLNDDTGYIEGTEGNAPNADINAGGGFIVEGEQGDEETPNQSLGDVNVGSNGEGTSGSIIGDNNLHIDDLYIKITVKGGRWYFFAFPFDIFFKDISMENGSDYVFRYYDGEERANKGNGGWKDINENHLKAARGYIFQCSANDVLVLNIKDVKFKKEDKYNELVAHVSNNLKDASWNFTGNPYLSYYDIADMDYSAPVTVWDGSKYVAIRPGDDDYHFAPYEAFFVQKPEEQDSIAFDGEEQMTQNQSNKKKEKQAAARRARGIDPERQLINLVLGNGTSDDRTRIVFNERQSLGYETSCDATKFETAGVAQLYTIGSDKVHYAINERPADNGVVMLGYTAPVAGFYTIEAQRMDAEVFVKDYKTGTLHNLKDGAYSFGTDAGTFNDRFEILLKGTAPGTTGIDEVKGENGEVKGEIYDLQGRKIQDAGKGIYIIDGEKVMK